MAPHVSSLISYYAELGAAEQQVFLSNAFAQILNARSSKYKRNQSYENVSGLLTGNINQNTYLLQTTIPEAFDILKSSGLKFIFKNERKGG